MKLENNFNFADTYTPDEINTIQEALTLFNDNEKQSAAQELSEILASIHVDTETIIAAIIFSSSSPGKEQTAITQHFTQSIHQLYSETVKLINEESNWIEKLRHDSIDYRNKDKLSTESYHMMLLSMMKDLRVVFILLAHQLLQMRHLKHKSEEQQKTIAFETKNIFAPLANKLGIGQLKWEMEDWSFRYLEPSEYKRIASALEERRVNREDYINNVVTSLENILSHANISAEVYGRPKHIYSIWKKMRNKDLNFDELYDVRAIRVLVHDIASCYAVLSAVHSHWPYIPGEYDDYIAAPKKNNYQSLHTAVKGPEEKVIEIQIRTHQMHEFAERGVAAHWRYKEGSKQNEALDEKIESLRLMLQEGIPKKEKDAFSRPLENTDNIYILTPAGDVIELPAGSTALDFAYYIHSELGHRCRGAKIKDQMISLTTPLQSGQQVEIITTKEAKPSRDWLQPHSGYLKSNRAKAKVRHWFKRQFKEEDIISGKTGLYRELDKNEVTLINWDNIIKKFNFKHLDDLYAAIGRGELGVHQIANIVREQTQPENTLEPPKEYERRTTSVPKSDNITVQGVGDLLSHLARCCKPMPADNIIGYVTRGRGISIHRKDCPNFLQLNKQNPERIIDVNWGKNENFSYEIDVEIIAMDRSGLLRDVSSLLASENVNVLAANTHTNKKNHEVRMRLTLKINQGKQLKNALVKLNQLQSVLDAYRVR